MMIWCNQICYLLKKNNLTGKKNNYEATTAIVAKEDYD